MARQAIEEMATLAACLGKVDDVPAALRLYQNCGSRVSHACRSCRRPTRRFHLPDGPAQHQRDAPMVGGSTDWSLAAVTWLYEHNAAVVPTEPASAAPVVKRSAGN